MPAATTPLRFALLGCGTVGAGVAERLLRHPAAFAAQSGRTPLLQGVAVRDAAKARPDWLPASLVRSDPLALVADPAVDCVVEVLGGFEPARTLILAALAAGKDVVTANKSVIAEHGDELLEAARRAGRTLCFEASVAGGIPLLGALTQGLAANRLRSVKAILNGTSNFILSRMTTEGCDYAAALEEAQRRGFAEADPALDVNGTDAAQKLAILARLAFGAPVKGQEIERRGISTITALDIRFAAELGYVIKLLAEAWEEDEQLALHVEPTLVRRHEPLAEVHGANNAVEVAGDLVGAAFFAGPGAGRWPTTSAVMADLIALADGSAARVFKARGGWPANRTLPRRPATEIHSRFFIRIPVRQQLGVLAEVDGVLARQGITLASVVSHEQAEAGPVSLVLVTHSANLEALRRALADLARLSSVAAPPVYYPIAD